MTTIHTQTFVCLDCETTGLEDEDRIIEVAAVRFSLDEEFDSTETLIDPRRKIPPASTEIHHITDAMIAGKPTIDTILPGLASFIGKHPIVGHNIPFDIKMLMLASQECHFAASFQENDLIDTLRLARIYGESPRNSLVGLREHFQLPDGNAHRAMDDVRTNIAVFRKLIKPYPSFQELKKNLAKPILMKVFPFGKHKGRRIQEIPTQYLEWIVRKKFDQDIMHNTRVELAKRKRGQSLYSLHKPLSSLGDISWEK